jgi:hypothetical protein
MSHTLLNIHHVNRIELEVSKLWPDETMPSTVTVQLVAWDKDGGRHAINLFCPDGIPHVEFARTHQLDLPLHRSEETPAGAFVVGCEWKPMNITLDEPKPSAEIPYDSVVLVDDGTLDTVIGIWCDHHGTHHEHRFDAESTWPCRDEKGLDLERFWREHIKDDDSLLCEEVGDGNP